MTEALQESLALLSDPAIAFGETSSVRLAMEGLSELPRVGAPNQDLRDLEAKFRGLVDLVRLIVLGGGLAEAAQQLGRTELLIEDAERLVPMAEQLAGERFPLVQPLSGASRSRVEPAYRMEAIPVVRLLRGVRSAAPQFPPPSQEEANELIAAGVRPSTVHALQRVCSRLEQLARRTGPAVPRVLRALGPAYAQGRISLGEVGNALGLPPEDAVLLLERNGYCRPVSVIRLGERQRAEFASAFANRVLAGDTDESLVRRLVLATQRIEDVDARLWLKTDQ